ncbi:MAG: 50S ribosomal protein L23 [SAR324 cluster bacterium]|nr:50S ribosomal protein L23 [SAR324 cluster bacterium]
MDKYIVLQKPYLSEKSIDLKEKHQQIIFQVHPKANKIEIKKAVEKIFKVKVEDVKTMLYQGKKKRRDQQVGRRAKWKKAILTLKKGDKIEYFEGT